MTVANSIRPSGNEHHEYYSRYIELVPDGDICELLEQQIDEFTSQLGGITEEQASVLHEPYTWTIKQAVGHMIDVEKVFGYRAHRFACNDLRPILGMEQDDFVASLDYTIPTLSDMVIELKCSRRSNLLFLRRMPNAAWDLAGEADGNRISVRAASYILAGHVTHHLEIFRKRIA